MSAMGLAGPRLALAFLVSEQVVDVLECGGVGDPRPEQFRAMV
jgi:hypothetical protein